MATSLDYIQYVCDQISGAGSIRYKKMFGEYMIYLNDKPVLLVCDDTVFVKKLDCVLDLMEEADTGFPYQGAKEHYILDIDNSDFSKEVIMRMEPFLSVPVPKTKKKSVE